MSDENLSNEKAFISYLDEDTNKREGYVKIIRFDASFVEFETPSGNHIIIPTARILKIKYKESENGKEAKK